MNTWMRRQIFAAALVILTASAAVGTQVGVGLSGPVLGYVLDDTWRQLRPIQGMPGSTTVGVPLRLDFAVSGILTLDAQHVVTSADAGSEVVVLDLGTSPPSASAIPGLPVGSALAAASGLGTSAAFYDAASQAVRIVTGLPRKPSATYRVDVQAPGRPLTHMAVSDDGALLIYAVDEGSRGEALFAWTASSEGPRFLTSAVSVSGIAISGGETAIVSDRGANQVFAIWDVRGHAVRQFLLDAGDGVSNPIGVAVSADKRMHVANASSGTVMVLDPAGRLQRTHRCRCAITGLHVLGDSVFRLTNRVDQTLFLLDAGPDNTQILFVPPARD